MVTCCGGGATGHDGADRQVGSGEAFGSRLSRCRPVPRLVRLVTACRWSLVKLGRGNWGDWRGERQTLMRCLLRW